MTVESKESVSRSPSPGMSRGYGSSPLLTYSLQEVLVTYETALQFYVTCSCESRSVEAFRFAVELLRRSSTRFVLKRKSQRVNSHKLEHQFVFTRWSPRPRRSIGHEASRIRANAVVLPRCKLACRIRMTPHVGTE